MRRSAVTALCILALPAIAYPYGAGPGVWSRLLPERHRPTQMDGLVGTGARHLTLRECPAIGAHAAERDREGLVCRIKGFYPFPQGIQGPVAWLFRDTHQAISISAAGGESKLLLDFMTEGGQAHPVWWDEAVKWRVLMGGSIRGEVRVRNTGAICPGTKLDRMRAAARAYDCSMNLYTNNCRIFCARMEREVQRLNDEDALDSGQPSAQRREALADARMALAIAQSAVLPTLYPISILLLCWTGLRDS